MPVYKCVLTEMLFGTFNKESKYCGLRNIVDTSKS